MTERERTCYKVRLLCCFVGALALARLGTWLYPIAFGRLLEAVAWEQDAYWGRVPVESAWQGLWNLAAEAFWGGLWVCSLACLPCVGQILWQGFVPPREEAPAATNEGPTTGV